MRQFEALLRSNSKTMSGAYLDEQKLDESPENSEEEQNHVIVDD